MAVAIFGIGASSIVYLILGSLETTRSGSDYTAAQEYLNEGWEATRSIGTNNYNALETSPTTYGVDDSSGEWVFSGTSNTDGYFTRTIDINPVYRDALGDIAPIGTIDINLREIIVNVSWYETPTKQRSISSTFYFSNWDSDAWLEDTVADFSDGTFTNTETTLHDDGEVALEATGAGSDDWGCVEQTLTYDISGTADYYDLDVVDNTLYMVRGSDTGPELVIYDVSSPDSPSLLGSMDLTTTGNAIKVVDDYAYIASIHDSYELAVVDVSDPAAPFLAGGYDAAGTANGSDLYVENDRVYLARESSSADEFFILNVSTPSTPVLVGSYDAGELIEGITVDTTNDVAYLATRGNAREIIAVDISTETAPVLHSEYDIPGIDNATDVALDDTLNYAIVTRTTDAASEIFVLNVSDPTNITAETDLEAGRNAIGVYVDGDYALVVTNDPGYGLITIDFSNPAAATTLSTVDIDGDANAVIAAPNHRIYVATSNDSGELMAFKAGGGWACPTFVGDYDDTAGTDAVRLDLVGDTLYMTKESSGNDELVILDVTDRSSPSLLGSIDIGDTIFDIDVEGNYAYLATNGDELVIVDVSNPGSLSIEGTFDATGGGDGYAVVVNADRAYLGRNGSNRDELYILDVSNPAAPVELDSFDAGDDVNGLAYSGGYVYLASDHGTYTFENYDVSLDTWSWVDYIQYPTNLRDVYINGNYAYVVTEDNPGDEFFIIDITDPTNYSEIGSAEINEDSYEVWSDGNYAFLSAHITDQEIMIYDVSDPANPSFVQSYDVDGGTYDIFGIEGDGNYLYATGESDDQELIILEPYMSSGLADTYVHDTLAEFNGSYSDTQWNTDHLELDATGITNGTGTYTSPIIDSGQTDSAWGDLAWTEELNNAPDLRMEAGSTTTTSSYSTVTLQNTYDNPVVVPFYFESNNADPVSVRLNNITATSFDIKLQEPDGTTPSSDTVHYFVMEEGVFEMPDGTLLEAGTIDSSTVASKANGWSGDNVSFAQSFTSAPVVMHAVQTENDSTWISSFISEQGSQNNPPTSTGFQIAMNGAEAVNSHGDETLGWVALETGTGLINGTAYEFVNNGDGTTGHANGCTSKNFSNSYSSPPLVIADQQEMDGGDGGWLVGCSGPTASGYGEHVEEDTVGDTDRGHTGETTAYIAFESAFDFEQSTSTNPLRIEVGSTSATSAFNTVNLQQTYTDPVIIPFHMESANTIPVSTRITNVTANSFDIKLDNPSGNTPSSETVYYIVSETGIYSLPGGTIMEVFKADTSQVSSSGAGWSGTNYNYVSSFSSAPVVLHHVQTNNDSAWIYSYVSEQGDSNNPPNTTGFQYSLNGAEVTSSHGSETIGFIILEQGTGDIAGIDFENTVHTNNTLGHDDGCYTQSFSGFYFPPPLVVAKQQGMAGPNGGWLVGCSGPSWFDYGAHIEEDLVGDTERNHTTEYTASATFEAAFDYEEAENDLVFQVRSCDDAGCVGESFIGPDGTSGTYYTTPIGEALNVAENQYFQYQVTFTSGDGVTTPELYDVTFDFGPPGGGGGGSYETAGTYLSNAYDAGGTVNWNTIEWTEEVTGCGTCEIKVQIRTAATPGALSSELWQGPEGKDGDETDFFTDPTGDLIHPDHNADQWIQYLVTLTGDGTTTPYFEDIYITYTNY